MVRGERVGGEIKEEMVTLVAATSAAAKSGANTMKKRIT
jgi:hypothetical protein